MPTPISDDIRNWKRGINEKIGLQFGINYQAVYLTASSGITDESQTSSAGGVLGLPVKWTPVVGGPGGPARSPS